MSRIRKDAVAIVTGGAGGLGQAIAACLVEAGCRVVVADRNLGGAERVAARFGKRGLAVDIDVRSPASAAALVRRAVDQFGGVDVLVNCAGIYPNRMLLDMTEEEWDTLLDINLKGCFVCGQAVARRMVDQGTGGVIVNIASTAAQSGRVGAGHYCASKAGVVALTRVMAMEWAPYRIRVNAVAPGVIDVSAVSPGTVSPEYRAAAVQHIPAGELGRPEDIAEAVVFLAGEGARYITGETLYVDGGFLAGRALPASQ